MKIKQRGWPDRRGMGAQSDFIAEQFIPSDSYKAQQARMTQALLTSGVPPKQLEDLFLVRMHLVPTTK